MNTSRLHKTSKRRRQVYLRKLVLVVFAAVLVAGLSLFPGSVLVDAHDSAETVMYKYYKSIEIQEGDSLWSIAVENMSEEYSTINEYIEEVMEINNLNSTQIHEGQYLIVSYYDILE